MRLAAIFFLFLVPTTCLAETLEGKEVVRIVDGDTLVILDESKSQHRVWLGGIDKPISPHKLRHIYETRLLEAVPS